MIIDFKGQNIYKANMILSKGDIIYNANLIECDIDDKENDIDFCWAHKSNLICCKIRSQYEAEKELTKAN